VPGREEIRREGGCDNGVRMRIPASPRRDVLGSGSCLEFRGRMAHRALIVVAIPSQVVLDKASRELGAALAQPAGSIPEAVAFARVGVGARDSSVLVLEDVGVLVEHRGHLTLLL